MSILSWLIFLMSAASSASHPNFSGWWQLDRQSSTGISPDTTTMWIKVEHLDSTIFVNLRAFHERGEENQTFVYQVGGTEDKNTMHGAPMQSLVKWNGDVLEFHSLAKFGDQSLTMLDHWTMSADNSVLTFREQSQFASEAQRDAVYVFRRRAEKDWPEDEMSEPAEKHFRNIQILTGQPASRLTATMSNFTRSLGVTCGQCHVVGQFELDSRPDKLIARQMLKMVARLNTDNFSQTNPVTCWTCHRGLLKPQNAPRP